MVSKLQLGYKYFIFLIFQSNAMFYTLGKNECKSFKAFCLYLKYKDTAQ